MNPQLEMFSPQSREWIESLRKIAVEIAERSGEVSADDIRDLVEIPAGVSRNALGSLFKCKLFQWKGVKKSRTPSRAGSMISVWALSNNYREVSNEAK